MEDEEYQFESNLEEEEDYGFGESSDESTEEIVDYEGMKNALELFQQVCSGFGSGCGSFVCSPILRRKHWKTEWI